MCNLKFLLSTLLAPVFFILPLPDILLADSHDPLEMNLEQLMQIDVFSVSRKAEDAFSAASAIYVITAENIRRSTATSVPELLRVVPGLQVARVDASRWAISARGINDVFANKLLVLVDGRTIYSPLFSGVYWDEHMLPLEDIQRIEVIRGPGAAAWGANAVNGVINILTKNAGDTTGGIIRGGGGNEHETSLFARQGVVIGENSAFRVYGSYDEFGGSRDVMDESINDDWWSGRGGVRFDVDAGESDSLTFQGEVYDGRGRDVQSIPAGPFAPPTTVETRRSISGGFFQGTWEHNFSDDSELDLKLFYDRAKHGGIAFSEIDTWDFDFQHSYTGLVDHSIVWGAEFRLVQDEIIADEVFSIVPASRTSRRVGVFVQDQIEIVAGKSSLTIGSKFEENDYTGFEIQPTVRLTYTPTDRQTLWASVSRAVRTPSRHEDGIMVRTGAVPLPDGSMGILTINGEPDLGSEELLAYEAGYRLRVSRSILVDVATFFNVYDNLRTAEDGMPVAVPGGLSTIPTVFDDQASAETYGIEVLAQWQVLESCRLEAGYSFIELDASLNSGSTDSVVNIEQQTPEHSATLRSLVDLTDDVEFDIFLRFIDLVPAFQVDSYVEMDMRVGWDVTDSFELAVIGNNLLDSRHNEFDTSVQFLKSAEIERSVFGRATFRF